MKVLILFFLIIIFFSGCHPDRFSLNKRDDNRIEGFIMSPDFEKVEITADNEFILYDGAMVSLRTLGLTQLLADFTVTLINGEGLTFYFRTVQNGFPEQPFIKFDYTSRGCSVSENGRLLVTVDSIRAKTKEEARIIIMNDGKLINITVDCDTVFCGRTELNATEFIIVKPYERSSALFSGIFFNDVITINEEIRESIIYEKTRKGMIQR